MSLEPARVVLVQPRSLSAALDYRYRGEHVGLSSMVAVLRQRGVDAIQLDDALDRRDLAATTDLIEQFNPHVVGIAVPAQQATGRTLEYTRAIRTRLPTVHLTTGGIFASVADSELLSREPSLDSVVRGEGEETIVELALRVWSGGDLARVLGVSHRDDAGKVVRNPGRPLERNLTSLPAVDRSTIHPLLAENRRVALYSGRGCYGECTFCSLHAFWGERRLRLRSPREVVDEMDALRQLGARKLRFINDIFLDRSARSRAWLDEFEKLVTARDLRLNLWMQFRAEDIDEVTLRRLRSLGLRKVLIGVESGDEASLIHFRKHITVEQNLLAVKAAVVAGVPEVAIGFIMFHPDSTPSALRANLDFLGRMPTFRYKNLFSRAVPYRGTAMAHRLEAEGLLDSGPNWYSLDTYRFVDKNTQRMWDSAAALKRSFGRAIWFENALDVEERLLRGTFDGKVDEHWLAELKVQSELGARFRSLLSASLLTRFRSLTESSETSAAWIRPVVLDELMSEIEKRLFRLQGKAELPIGYHLDESATDELLD